MPDEELTSLWCFRKGNFHFWPVVRPSAIGATEESAKDAHKAVKDATTREKKDKARKQALEVFEFTKAPVVIGMAGPMGEHMDKLTLPLMPEELATLRDRLRILTEEALASALNSSEEGLTDVRFSLAFGKLDKQKIKPDGQVAFDLEEGTINTSKIRQQVEAALATSSSSGHDVVCSLSGMNGIKHQGKLPNPALPVVAPSGIAVFSMFSEAPTNTRYGRTDDAIIQVTSQTIQACLNAVRYVTRDESQGNSWTRLPNGKRDKRTEKADLLIAFAAGIEAKVADGFGGGDPETNYADVLRPVLSALEGKCKLTPNADVHLVAIRQISNAQLQAVYCRTPMLSQVLEAGRRWEKAQQQLPELVVTSHKSKWLLSPGRAVSVLLRRWVDVPVRETLVPGPSGGDLLDFFLSKGEERRERAMGLLDRLLYVDSHLLAWAGSEARRFSTEGLGTPASGSKKGNEVKTKEPAYKRYVVESIKLLALIYNAMGRTMEQTQHSPPYQLGLLLGVVDTLHLCYCQKVRNSIPPSLGGGQLLGIAADDPTRALSDLLERIRPWSDWANTVQPKGQDDKAALRAKKALARLSSIAPQLQGNLERGQLDQIGRADLLLGYLSKDREADQYAEASTPPPTRPEQNHE
ncbi:MAG TPA: hypothetical protein PLH94_07080 [Fimbriimonadaceae bacterium]|nr:hypothetical protein [Fimbriimonadaceae bacterium]